jgi:glycogen operon protein
MHVDGFRFDMASILARVKGGYSKDSIFFDAVSKDPVLNKVKLIAEPWDFKTYQVVNFPILWSEWNGKFRDTLRRFIKGHSKQIKDLAWRLSGSADLYGDDERSPYNSINFITCHDGFTLRDLFSYNNKHNEANGEENKDGINENYSWNWGLEGETEDVNIINLRKQLIKNAICRLVFSLGTTMLLGGDEFMRTQRGNNNAYCQDNEISWFDWKYVKKNSDILAFCKKAIAFRKRYTILQNRKFLTGKDQDADNVPDVAWFGKSLERPSWDNPELRFLSYQHDGSESPSKLGDYHLFFILNADVNSHTIKIPQFNHMKWYRVVDTSLKSGEDFLEPGKELLLKHEDYYQASPRSTVVLLGK